MKELNELVLDYKRTKDETIFERIYEMISATWKNNYVVAKSVMTDEHEIQALCEDILMGCIDQYDGSIDFIHYYRSSLYRRRASLYKAKKRYYKRIEPTNDNYNEDGDTPIAATIECIPEPKTTEELALQKTEADQRQLIDFLLSGADATTTAIVEAFLAHPKPTPTAIGRSLGLHHSVVKRKLERLASKFDAKQFGDYRDYLAVAR
jgi:hypothetical protein